MTPPRSFPLSDARRERARRQVHRPGGWLRLEFMHGTTVTKAVEIIARVAVAENGGGET